MIPLPFVGLYAATVMGGALSLTRTQAPDTTWMRLRWEVALRIDASTPYALIGRLDLTGREQEAGATVTLAATFSAGCALAPCR